MSDRHIAWKAREVFLLEGLAHKAHCGVHPDVPAIAGGDSRALLASVLKRVQPEECDPGHILPRRIDSDYPAGLSHVVIRSCQGRHLLVGYLVIRSDDLRALFGVGALEL